MTDTRTPLPDRMIGRPVDIVDDIPDEVLDRFAAGKAYRDEYHDDGWRDGPLHVITDHRQTGKTALAIRWMLEAPDDVRRVVIVANERMAELLRLDYELDRGDTRIIGYRRALSAIRGRRDRVEYAIDDAVHILADVLGLQQLPHMVVVNTAD